MAGAAVEIVTEVCRRFAEDEDPFPLLDENITWKVPMLDQQDAFCGHRGVAEFFRRWLGTSASGRCATARSCTPAATWTATRVCATRASRPPSAVSLAKRQE